MVYETTKQRKRRASASQPDETTTKRSRPTTDAEDVTEADENEEKIIQALLSINPC